MSVDEKRATNFQRFPIEWNSASKQSKTELSENTLFLNVALRTLNHESG